uniref:DNA gyrase inhibitory protein n=1 Tax=Colwellia sp. C1 TaxID=1737566 RepID=A0A168PHW6_9GAMM|nr:DNA gyrase inhibitory protein [Colwellia sp. C1]
MGIADEQVDIQVKTLYHKRLCKLLSKDGPEPDSLFKTRDTLNNWAVKQGVPQDKQFRLAWCYDNPAVTPVNKCRYEVSIEVNEDMNITEPFSEKEFPEGIYAVIYVKGTPDDITQAQIYLFSCWLPNSGYEPDNLPMLERYLNDVRVDGFLESEIMIKLKPLK